jgi:hypothetical protein
MRKTPVHESDLYHRRSLGVAGILCIIVGLLLFYSEDSMLSFGFSACGVLTITYSIIAKDSLEEAAASSKPTSSKTEEC